MRQSYSHLISAMGYPKLLRSWCHEMETFSALLAICAGNSLVTGEFPAQRPVMRSFDVFFDLRWINGGVNNGEAGDLRHHRAHYDVTVMWYLCFDPSGAEINKSISWLLLRCWIPALPEHQQPCYLICKINKSLCFSRNNFNCLWHLHIEKSWKMEIFWYFKK